MNKNSSLRLIKRGRRLSSRRRGVSLVLFALSMPVIFGCLAIVIDMGNLYNIRSRSQRAADAAALAGALVSDGTGSSSNAATVTSTAQNYAGLNQFPTGRPGVTVTVIPSTSSGTATSPSSDKVRVIVQQVAAVYFSPIMEGLLKSLGLSTAAAQFSRVVTSEATAERVGSLPLKIPGFYGIADPNKTPANLSVFGRYAEYQWGDPFSVQYLQDGTPNPEFKPNGYEYTINVDSKFTSGDNKMYLQIFDPDSYSPSGNSWDEQRGVNSKNPAGTPTNANTNTEYKLVAPDGRVVATRTYGADSSVNEKWVTPDGFAVDINTYGRGKYKLYVKTLDGGSENGFLLRGGPKEGIGLSDVDWNNKYGDVNNTKPENVAVPINAEGSLQMNFTKSGTVTFALGEVDGKFAGKTITVDKFDVDVGSQSISYKSSSLPNDPPVQGKFPDNRNATWSSDPIQLPSNYTTGVWSVTYVAGAGDTSNWRISGASNTDSRVYLSK